MANRDEIVKFLDERLDIHRVKDKSSNGLQVSGAGEVTKIAVATDAAMATYKRAAFEGCQMMIVHHGLIWGGMHYITFRNRDHLKFLLDHDINLYAAHLPLDMHPEIGNNALLAKHLGLVQMQPFGLYNGDRIGFSGLLPEIMTVQEIAEKFALLTGGMPRVLDFGPRKNKTAAIVSGGGGSTFGEAVEGGFGCFITGEISHEIYNAALEGKVNIVLLGHYLSETLGVQALGKEINARFGVPSVFIDEPTGF